MQAIPYTNVKGCPHAPVTYQLYGYSNPCKIMNAFTPHNASTL